MNFEVKQSLVININGTISKSETSFIVGFEMKMKTNSERVYSIDKENINKVLSDKNTHLMLLDELECLTYPIEIATDFQGDFLKIQDHQKWLSNWEDNSLKLIEKYDSLENAQDIRDKYYAILSDEKTFTSNKFREPFWNLLFFNPPFDNVNKPDLGTTLQWYIKSIGLIPCKGRTKIINPASKQVIIHFESQQQLTDAIIEAMQSKAKFQNIKWDKQKANLQVESEFDTIVRKIKNKTAVFELVIAENFSYFEKTVIDIKN